MDNTVSAIHCVNQFFGGLGGEEQAGIAPQFVVGTKGPGLLVQNVAPRIKIIATIVFGDNYVAENTDAAVTKILELIHERVASGEIDQPELLLAGPAFNAGRYGMACGAICDAVRQQMQIAVVTAMFDENPGVDAYRKTVTIARCGANVMDMKEAVERMAHVALKLVQGEQILPQEDHAISHGLRQNYFAARTGAQRGLDMLLKKLLDEPFSTEYAMPVFDRVPPAPCVRDLSTAKLALVTSGGIVPRGNPDRIPSASAQRYGEYSLAGLNRLTAETHQTVHGGYDPTYANADPNRVLPLDVMRELEAESRIGELSSQYFATVGNATSVENAKRFGEEIAARLISDRVQAVILTST